MKREIITTSDGSHTVQLPDMQVTYHSRHGAIQESMHVFIQAGLHEAFQRFASDTIYIFEMGLGTGLNALLTALEATKEKRKVHYTAVELYPLTPDETAPLNYDSLLMPDQLLLQKIHQSNWNEDITLTEYFTLHKQKTDVKDYHNTQGMHVIYYDAFAPGAQPELWTEDIFKKLYQLLVPNGLLVTYCSKSDVRRAMIAAGFTVTKLPGPPGKREMLRASSNPSEENA